MQAVIMRINRSPAGATCVRSAIVQLLATGCAANPRLGGQHQQQHNIIARRLLACCLIATCCDCYTQVNLRLDTSLQQDKLPCQTFVSRGLQLGDKPLATEFVEVPCDVQYGDVERVGGEH
jgi:hypothetical protein